LSDGGGREEGERGRKRGRDRGKEEGRAKTHECREELEEHDGGKEAGDVLPLLVLDAVAGQQEGKQKASHAQDACHDA
jgi:hypothetical protein